ncbi:hypothetical protein HOY80DRAFT_1109226 [Tuber brumale]|nr:hypothetical protein HOY80DRAFT_1109226 [Tuber brumale]
MNVPPNQPSFQPGAPHPWPANAPSQNFQSPQPCYNCGSTTHIAQFCPEPRRQVPAGSVNQPPRTHRVQKKSSKPIITRYPHPTQYPTTQPPAYQPPQPQAYPQQAQTQAAYPSQVPPQVYPTQASPSPVSPYPPQQPSQQWQQPYTYNAHQQWPQPSTQAQPHYAPHATAASPTAAYGPHQPAAYQGYSQPSAHQSHPQPPQPRTRQPYYNYPQGAHAPPVHPPTSFNPQFHRPQHQFRQRQNNKHRSQHHASSFQQQPQRNASPAQAAPGPSQTASQATANNRREPPPPKPPPCFPNTQAPITQFGKSGKIVYKPPERVEKPLAATFAETDAQRSEKTDDPEKPTDQRVFSTKYFDEKGARVDGYVIKPGEDGEPEDPAYNSVRTGGSMLSQPLEFALSGDPEKNGDAELQKMLKELEYETKIEIYGSLNGEDKKGLEEPLSVVSRPLSRGSGGSGKASEGGKEGSKKRGWHKNLEDSSHDGSEDRRPKRLAKGNKKTRGNSPSSITQPSVPLPQHHPLPPKPKVPGFRGGRGGRHHRHAPSPARQYQVHREGGNGAGRSGNQGFPGDHIRPVT